MAIRTERHPQAVAIGSAGSGAVTQVGTHTLNGLLLAIGVSQGNTPHANTDITISISYDNSVTRTLLTLTNNNTTALTWYDVRELLDDTVGASITGQYSLIPLNGYATVVIAQGGSGATCDVTFIYADD